MSEQQRLVDRLAAATALLRKLAEEPCASCQDGGPAGAEVHWEDHQADCEIVAFFRTASDTPRAAARAHLVAEHADEVRQRFGMSPLDVGAWHRDGEPGVHRLLHPDDEEAAWIEHCERNYETDRYPL